MPYTLRVSRKHCCVCVQAFLEDYGMIWVGEQSDPDSSVYNSDDLISLSAAGRQGTWTQGHKFDVS